MGRGRPKGSKNKPKDVKTEVGAEKPGVPAISNEEQFDNLNKSQATATPSTNSSKPIRASSTPTKNGLESSPKKRVLQKWDNKENDPDDPDTIGSEDEDEELVEDIGDAEGTSEAGGKGEIKSLKIIQLGTEEVKKYAIVNKDGAEDEDDYDDDYDREDREISFAEDDGVESERGDESYYNPDRAPEECTIKVAKKYPSKQKFPCPKCDKVWSWPWELRRHLMIHFKPQKLVDNGFKCPHCDKRFQWKRDMRQHERIHSGDKVLICSVCEKQFTTKQALLHHVVVHTGEKPFQCAVCGNKFTQPANLRTHVKKKHAYSCESNKTNKCEYCGEPHVSIVGLHQHLLEDHPQQVQEERELLAREKQEKLAERDRKEREKEERRIKREQLGHRVRKPRKKEWELDYEFYIGDGLVRGVDWDRTPSNGEIACGQCDRKFGWRFEIMFHGLCHLLDEQGNARNKICPECDTPFKVPIGLKHHLITHTGETPFLCLHCWKSFSSHIDLKLHIKKEHMMHLNTKTDRDGAKKKEKIDEEGEVIKTSHFVQLEDGSYAEMVEGHEMVGPGEQMLVEDEDGQQMVVVNPTPGSAAQTVMIPQQAETVYVIASQNENNDTIVPDNSHLHKLIGDKDGIEMIIEDSSDKNIIRMEEM